MNFLKRFSVFAALTAALISTASAEIPAGYYDSCTGKTGKELLQALYQKITSHTNVGYDGLWNVYKKSDVRADGTLWDIYTTKRWSSSFTKCGNYKLIGDCVNREHSMPKSVWGGGSSAQYSDAFHLYPTDGKVNGQRSNYPYGECANGTRLPDNGSVQALGKLGTCTFSGYSGKVFEPDDEYKGDLARSYFYMATCYNNIISSWTQGEMGNMMGGNNYPVFKTWAVNLLLKWARQDEVSQKEIDRNDAIYSFQHNRNPFIDHPELVEYIWGDKVGQPWNGSAVEEPDILQPVQNVTIDLGMTAVGITRTVSVPVKTKNVTGTVAVSVYGTGFSVSPKTLSAAQANAGTNVTVTLNAQSAGTLYGTFSVSADDMEREVDMKATAYDGIPLYDAANVSSNDFTVRWVSVGDAASYTLHVKQGAQYLAGYPKTVTASAESYTVTGLDPLTEYTFYLTSASLQSEIKTVTTADLIPSVDVLFDGELYFTAKPGEPSEVAELLLDIENIAEDITITVDAPFSVSTDRTSWGTSVTLSPEEDRFYMRALSQSEGEFATTLLITAGTYLNDDVEARAAIADVAEVDFIETFNVATSANTNPYKDNVTFDGVMCGWKLNNAGLAAGEGPDNSNAIRMGKTATSTLTMTEDKTGGIGTITFNAANWTDSEGEVTMVVEISTDQGSNWTPCGTFTFSSGDFAQKSATVNRSGNARIRFRQTAGARWILDDVAISNYSSLGAVSELPYHSWDAFCRDSQLVIDCGDKAQKAAVYSIDGLTLVNEILAPGEHSFDLAKGLYIVVVDDFARRVLVK